MHAVHVLGELQVLQFLSEQLTQALPLATYPAAQLHTPLFNVKVE